MIPFLIGRAAFELKQLRIGRPVLGLFRALAYFHNHCVLFFRFVSLSQRSSYVPEEISVVNYLHGVSLVKQMILFLIRFENEMPSGINT